MRESIWTKNLTMPQFQKLNGEIKTDVLIIGGGLCGILCAYFLNELNIDYVLVEVRNGILPVIRLSTSEDIIVTCEAG